MSRYILMTVASLFMAITLSAQSYPHCGTDEYTELLINSNPEVLQKYEQADAAMQRSIAEQNQKKGTQAVVYTIPVVVHVIHNSPYDNINKSQILDAIDALNDDFRRLNADASNTRPIFQGRAADIEVEFDLAKKDPNGNCTDGINRIQSSNSINAHDNVKDLIHWDNSKYLNIWVVNSIKNSSSSAGTILGYAYRPFFGQSYKRDGIVIRHDRVGRIGTGSTLGRTLTHEVGHYLGLNHPFNDGCNNHGDGIADTPPVATPSNGCNFNANTCHTESPDLPDMVENYMDYSDDACQNAFTLGQKNAMRASIQTAGLRKELTEENNLIATGVNNPPACAPTARFTLPQDVICQGTTVQFLDETEDGDPSTYSWTLPGATPATSAAANPIVQYNSPGVYNVSLTVTNSAGTSTFTLKKVIRVRPKWTPHQAQWSEDFETTPVSHTGIDVQSNYDTVGFRVTNLASSSGGHSLFLDNFNATEPKDVDYLVSPNIQTLFGENMNLSFDYAYAQRAGNEIDLLRIYVSRDCGNNWIILRTFAGLALRTTANPSKNPFVPTSTEWKTSNINLASHENKGTILLKFEFRGDGGNNFYIDNINVTSSNIGLEENDISSSISMYPNPAKGKLTLTFADGLNTSAEISINDLSGRTILKKSVDKGTTDFIFEDLDFPAGVYLVSVNLQGNTVIKKLIIE